MDIDSHSQRTRPRLGIRASTYRRLEDGRRRRNDSGSLESTEKIRPGLATRNTTWIREQGESHRHGFEAKKFLNIIFGGHGKLFAAIFLLWLLVPVAIALVRKSCAIQTQ